MTPFRSPARSCRRPGWVAAVLLALLLSASPALGQEAPAEPSGRADVTEWIGGPVGDLLFGTGPIAFVQQAIGLGHEDLFRWLALLGDTWGIMLALGVAFWYYGRDSGYAVLGALVLATLVKVVLAKSFGVPRPAGPEIVVYEELSLNSFPSGHVFETVIPWGVLYVRDRLPLVIAVVIPLVVALTRLYLGVHYLGDVLFALPLGALFVWGYAAAYPRLADWFYDRSVRFYVILTSVVSAGVVGSLFVLVNTARRWEILGLVVGGGFGLIAEHQWVCYAPPEDQRRRRAVLGIGLLGMAVALVAVRYLGDTQKVLHLIAGLLIIGWATLGVPAIGRARYATAHERTP